MIAYTVEFERGAQRSLKMMNPPKGADYHVLDQEEPCWNG